MCQSKEKGGKRCLAHAAASKFSVRVTTVKTGADAPFVEKALSELSREGKNLPNPRHEDVQNWIDTRRFATQYDPELSEHERKIELNQLDRAAEEVKAGVSGGHFHAWKNVMDNVKEKMHSRFVAAALVPIIAVGAAGCGNQIGPGPDQPKPGVSQAVEAPQKNGIYYDEGIYSVAGSGEKFSDSDGEFETILRPNPADPDSSPMFDGEATLNTTADGQQLKAAGFTAADVDEAHRLAYNMVLDVSFDNEIADRQVSDSEYAEWYNNTMSKYNFDAEISNDLSNKENKTVLTGYVDQNQGALPKLVHDGTPRATGAGGLVPIVPTRVNVLDVNGTSNIVVSMQTDFRYRVSDQSAIEYTAAITGRSKDEVLNNVAKPQLKDGSGVNYLKASGTYDVAMKKNADGSFTITGIQSSYEFDASDYITG